MPRARLYQVAVPLAIVLLVVALWLILHPPPPFLATSDLYTHLSVARHLADGDGFLCDVTYPLSFAFPWARTLPQPLIHRPPGYALLLVPIYLIAGGDPQQTLVLVHWLMAVVLGATLWLGITAFSRCGRRCATAPWLVLWLSSPLLVFVFGWGQVEAVVGLVMLTLWLRWRVPPAATPSEAHPPVHRANWSLPGWSIDGTLCAALTLLRPELIWLPLLWWYGLRWLPVRQRPVPAATALAAAAATDVSGTPGATGRRRRRDALLTLAVWCALVVPWAGRNWRLTGNPFFSLQSYAEHVKMTDSWPQYTVYRSLQPQPLGQTLRDDPSLVLGKTRAGIGFFLRHLGNWLPWSLLTAGAALWLARRRWRLLPGEPLFLVGMTGAVLILLYAPFDHELRHLVPLWPIATWELCLLGANALGTAGLLPDQLPRHRAALLRSALLVLVVAVGTWLTPAQVPGWVHAAQIATRDAPRTAALVARADELPPGPVFCDNVAMLWLTGRAGVWAPIDDEVAAEIRRRVPQLTHAPWLRLNDD